jgi:RHS repeat-associated protein
MSGTVPFTFTDSQVANTRARFYRAFGTYSTITNNLRFPGQYSDAESGLNYNMMRDYDSTIGRYIQGDIIGLSGGINLYSYAIDRPTDYSDALGLDVTIYGELFGHETFAVGQPGGPQFYFNFGPAYASEIPLAILGIPISGRFYNAPPHAGMTAWETIHTTPEIDEKIIAALQGLENSDAPMYQFPLATCRTVPRSIINDIFASLGLPSPFKFTDTAPIISEQDVSRAVSAGF